jgi:hypothetical protein
MLVDALKSEMASLPTIVLNDFQKPHIAKQIYGIAQFSDWHIGKIIDSPWNLYNKEISVQRVNTLINKIIEKSQLHHVTDLIIEINGDMVDGIIQVSNRNVAEADVISQIAFVSELLSQAINKLIPHYQSVKVITTLGNHGRIFGDRKLCVTKENFEMLIAEFLKLRLEGKVSIIQSYGFDFTTYEINGEMICVSHGQNDSLNTVIADFCKIYKKVPKEIHLGHTHSYKDINDNDIHIVVNGSLCGADDYAITSCRSVTKPSQNFIVYSDKDRCVYELSVE